MNDKERLDKLQEVKADHAALVARVREIAEEMPHSMHCASHRNTHGTWPTWPCDCERGDLLAALGPEKTR